MFVDPGIKAGGNRYKPNPVVKNEEQILMVDVTVCYEYRDCRQKAPKEKIDKYFPCLNILKNKYDVDEGAILPAELGSGGSTTAETIENLKELGVINNETNTIVLNVLCNSIETCNLFLDGCAIIYVGDGRTLEPSFWNFGKTP